MSDFTGSFRQDLFAGRRVLVSGASSGLGLGIARGFAALGAHVTATGSSATKLSACAEDPANSGIEFVPLDVRDGDAIAAFFAGISRLDILVNAAGTMSIDTPFDEAAYLNVIDVNLHGALRLALAAHPLLAAVGGSIINITSSTCRVGNGHMIAYTASKSALEGLTRTLAHRFGPDGVRVNALLPGFHRTDMAEPLWSDSLRSARVVRRTALGRWGEVDDVVGPAIYLASPAAAYVTGSTLSVDGGWFTGSGIG